MFMVTEEIVLVLAILILAMLYRYGSLLYSVIGYVLVQALINIHYPNILSIYLKHDVLNSENLLAMNSASSLIFVGVLLVFFLSLKDTKRAIATLQWVVILECLIVLWSKYIANHAPWGLLLTSTMDGMFLGMTFPWMLKKEGRLRILFVLLPIITLFVTDSAIGEGALVLGLILLNIGRAWKYLIAPLIIGIVCLWVNPNLFNDSQRFVAWVWTIKWWWANANIYFGTGLGTYWSLSYHVQKAMGVMNKGNALYTFLHNDWAQSLFELGVVGSSLIFTLFCNFVWRVRGNRTLLTSLVVYGACAFLNFPVRNIISAAYGMLLLRLAIGEENA